MKLNLNDTVKVKLTEVGKQHLLRRHQKIYRCYPESPKPSLPEEDENGYSEWQLWDLMGHFGDCLQYPTMHPPFCPEIEIIAKKVNTVKYLSSKVSRDLRTKK